MAIGNDELLFIHVPRTGGTWAIQAMIASGIKLTAENPDKHHLVRRECDFRGRFVFAFVRDPATWYLSQYNYRREMRFNDGFPGDPWLDLPFPEFVEKLATHHPGHLTQLYNDFIGYPDEEPLSFVGRFENLVDDTVKALRMAGVEYREDILRGWKRANASRPSATSLASP